MTLQHVLNGHTRKPRVRLTALLARYTRKKVKRHERDDNVRSHAPAR